MFSSSSGVRTPCQSPKHSRSCAIDSRRRFLRRRTCRQSSKILFRSFSWVDIFHNTGENRGIFIWAIGKGVAKRLTTHTATSVGASKSENEQTRQYAGVSCTRL